MRPPRYTPLLLVGLTACALHRVPAPAPGQLPEVTVMTSVVERVRRRPPHREFALAVAPVTVNYEVEHYPLGLRAEFAGAVADLEAKRGRLDRIGPQFIGGVPVRRLDGLDPYDVRQYLLARFSPVGFSPDSSRAVVLVVFDCGPGCGARTGVGLRRAANRGWRIAQYRTLPFPAPDANDPP